MTKSLDKMAGNTSATISPVEVCSCGHGQATHALNGECFWMGDGESGWLETCGCERFTADAVPMKLHYHENR